MQLLTVHAAKGLEFDHVFVLTLSDGEFPARPQAPVLEFPAELMKEEQPKGEFRIQEERRLFYVAMTRARRLLTLSHDGEQPQKAFAVSRRYSGRSEIESDARGTIDAEGARAEGR